VKINAGKLTEYLNATIENHNNHAQEPPYMMGLVHEMDEIFHKEIFAHDYDANSATMLLAMNSYMMLSNAIHQSLSGHMVAVFPVVRTALESACYAYLTSSDEKMEAIWFNRGKSKTATGRCRDAFTIGAAIAKLKQASPDMADYVKKLYDSTIEYGAHPNIKSISHHLRDKGLINDAFRVFTHVGVYGENSRNVNSALLLCVETGHAIAFLLSLSAKGHPFVNSRLDIFEEWIDKTHKMADELD